MILIASRLLWRTTLAELEETGARPKGHGLGRPPSSVNTGSVHRECAAHGTLQELSHTSESGGNEKIPLKMLSLLMKLCLWMVRATESHSWPKALKVFLIKNSMMTNQLIKTQGIWFHMRRRNGKAEMTKVNQQKRAK